MPSLAEYPLGRILWITAVVGVAMLALDLVWLRVRASMYQASVRDVQGQPLRIRAGWAAAAYLIMVASIPAVAVPAAHRATLPAAALSGAMLGLAVYGVFNATNAAIFADYPARMALQDTLWGTTLFASASMLFVALM